MLSERLKELTVRPDATIREAMSAIERGNSAVALVVDRSGVPRGLLTDGDIRRELLRGSTLDSKITSFYNRNFYAVGPSVGRAEVLDLMRARGIQQIPIVDRDSHLLGLHTLREIIGGVKRPNWAVLMAGGRGIRLDPLTQKLPKPMLPVAGRPIVERLVLHLVSFGFHTIFLSICHLGHLIEEHFGDGRALGCRIEYLRESKFLGTAGCLSLLPTLPEHPLVVMNGDLVTDVDIAQLLLFHEEHNYAATVCIREYRHTVPFGVLELGEDSLLGMTEKPTFHWMTNAGVYVLNPKLVARVPKDQQLHMPDVLKCSLASGDKIGAYQIDREWMDIGQVGQLRRAQGKGA